MIALIKGLFRRRKLQPKFPSLGIHEGCTVMVHAGNHRWNGKAGFVVSLPDPTDPFQFYTVQREGDVEFFLPRQLSTRLAFAFAYERRQPTR